MDSIPLPVVTVATPEDSAVSLQPKARLPRPQAAPSPIDASTHLNVLPNASSQPRSFWAMIAAQSPGAILNIVVVAVVFFMINSNTAQQRDVMDYIKDSAKSDRDRQAADIHTLIAPMENICREMKDGRTEAREEFRKSNEKFDKQNDAIKAAVEEIRKIKTP